MVIFRTVCSDPCKTGKTIFSTVHGRMLQSFKMIPVFTWVTLLLPWIIYLAQFSSVAQSCLTLCDPMHCSMPGLPVHHQLLELDQTHVHQAGDTIQPSPPVVPLSSCLQSIPASRSFLMTQFFTSSGQSIGASVSASLLPMNIQNWFALGNFLVGFPCSPGDSQESSPTPQLKSIHFSVLSFLYGPTFTSVHDY